MFKVRTYYLVVGDRAYSFPLHNFITELRDEEQGEGKMLEEISQSQDAVGESQ
jgi:hypothetical protein